MKQFHVVSCVEPCWPSSGFSPLILIAALYLRGDHGQSPACDSPSTDCGPLLQGRPRPIARLRLALYQLRPLTPGPFSLPVPLPEESRATVPFILADDSFHACPRPIVVIVALHNKSTIDMVADDFYCFLQEAFLVPPFKLNSSFPHSLVL